MAEHRHVDNGPTRGEPPFGTVTVAASSGPYEVRVGPGLDLAAAVSGSLLPGTPGGTAVLLTDSNVGPLHAANTAESLRAAGYAVADTVTVPAGEGSKSLSVYEGVVRRMAAAGIPRSGALFALGGGVVGDLGGFVASSYARGIDLFQLPTSLLAMVDSSVGGKVGLDLPEGKNLIGAFLQPRLVAADLDWLTTLPAREVSHGLAEVVKMGLLAGGAFYDDLVDSVEAARAGEEGALRAMILHSVRYKASVVERDEREAGPRAVLNYGHTIGHGLEAALGYDLAHGEAVAVGMLAAARLSRERYGLDLVDAHERLLRAAGLPTTAPRVDVEPVLSAMGRDKKRRASDAAGSYRFVLLQDVGRPVPDVPVSAAEARRAIEAVLD